MALNESKGNMYSWITHTWNPIKGECPHGCSYCYMKRWGEQKPIRLDESEFKTDLGSGNFIFVGSSCDMFAREIPEKWILDTLNHCESFYKNKYLFQSKNPEGFVDFGSYMPADSAICTTIETNRWYSQMENAPKPQLRADWMFWTFDGFKRYVTIEPIMDFDLDSLVELIKICKPEQVNIGADSGNNGLPEPPKEKILELISELQKFTTIDQKRNLNRILRQ